MNKILILVFLLFQYLPIFAQSFCAKGDVIREIQLPLAENDTTNLFFYFNDEWIPGADIDMIEPDSVFKLEIKYDKYGNHAIFFTMSPTYLSRLKVKVDEIYNGIFVNYDPICEFPGGNRKLKEWLYANIRIPEGYKGTEKVLVMFKVQPDGSATNPKLLKPSKTDAVNAEALRLVKALPKFNVKYFAPEKLPVGMALPIIFDEPGKIYIRGNSL